MYIMIRRPTWKVPRQRIERQKPGHPWIVVAGTIVIIPRLAVHLLRIKLVRRAEAGAALIDEDLAEGHVLEVLDSHPASIGDECRRAQMVRGEPVAVEFGLCAACTHAKLLCCSRFSESYAISETLLEACTFYFGSKYHGGKLRIFWGNIAVVLKGSSEI